MSKFTVKATNTDAETIIDEFYDALEAMSIERFLNVWHDNGVQVMPYAPKGFRARLEGKEAIRRDLGDLFAKFKIVRIPDRVFYFTNDPNRVWVEFRREIQNKATGKFYTSTFVSLFSLSDKRIIEYKEYSNPIIQLNAFGNPKRDHAKIGRSPEKK